MIPIDIENRIASYFFHMYLPENIMREIENRLLPSCIMAEEQDLDPNELVHWAIEIIDRELENKRYK